MPLMFLALALQLPVQQPTRADVVIRVDSRYDARAETGGSLRIQPKQQTFLVDSMRTFDSTRRIHTRTMQVEVDANGLATAALERSPARRRPPSDSALMRRIAQEQLLAGSSAGVLFPEEQLARVFRQFPTMRLRAGERWTEPVDWRGERNGVRAEERGMRTTVVIRDTLVDGRVHWIMRDSVVLQRQEEWPEHSYSLIADITHRSESSGTRTSRWVYDPARAIAVARTDTTRFDGTVTRLFPDGRTVDARYAVTRYDASTALSPQQYDEVRAAESAEFRRQRGGMVRNPPTLVEQRIAAGDSLVIDSLVSAWISGDLMSRQQIELQIMMSAASTRATMHRRLSMAALQIGDTASAFALTKQRQQYFPGPFNREDLQFLVGYLEDPRRALRNGIGPDAAFPEILNRLMNAPPALARDGAGECRERVCALLEHYANRNDVDPRLNDLAAIALYYQDPRGGFAALEQRAASGTAMARRVYREALGYPGDSRPGEGEPLPSAGADWQAWAAWGGGSTFRSARVLRLHSLRTGRDFVREFREGYTAATTDTARFVFGALLITLDTAAFGTDEVVQLVTSSSPTLKRLGERAMHQVLRSARPASDAVAAPLLNDLIAMMLEGTLPRWQNAGQQQRRQGAPGDVIMISDSLPRAVQERWRDRVALISRAEWEARDPRVESMAHTVDAKQAGPFVILDHAVDGRLARSADEVPYRYGAGETIVLLQTADGWRVVSRTGWAT